MDNNMTFLNACRNGQKSIVQIFLKKGFQFIEWYKTHTVVKVYMTCTGYNVQFFGLSSQSVGIFTKFA